jgi:prolyl-tRNA synthetase
MVVDREAAVLQDFVCGANVLDKHLINVNWQRDVWAGFKDMAQLDPSSLNLCKAARREQPECISTYMRIANDEANTAEIQNAKGIVADIRKVVEGDLSPDGKGKLRFARGIEVGHIFQLGDKYSKAMKATVLNVAGKATTLLMGCYGIGVSRIVAAAIEQNHDEYGIIWPDPIAPFQIALIPISMHQSYRVREVAEKLYQELQQAGFEVLFDDRKERAGIIFSDMDLIGIPHRVVISESGIDKGTVEYKARKNAAVENIALDQVVEFLKMHISTR